MRQFFQRYHFRIAFCLVLAATVCIVEILWMPYQREKGAATLIENLGGRTRWVYHGPSWIPDPIKTSLPFLWSLIGVSFQSTRAADTDSVPTELDDAHLVILTSLSALEVLDLTGTRVTDAGLNGLSHLRSLKVLHLSETRTTAVGRNQLRKTLTECNITPVP